MSNPTSITFLKYELYTEMGISNFFEMKLIGLNGYDYCFRRFLGVASVNKKVRVSALSIHLNYLKNFVFVVLFSNFILFFNCQTPNLKVEFLSFYLAELSLLDYDCIRFLPSIVAASSLFLASFIISPEVHPWVSIYVVSH